ncbi:hypothetical protein ONZ45_g15865 [Pleurotus djamor]|nr:hypothetical protein ONZ45_g15865 [Pleurotus djamor]
MVQGHKDNYPNPCYHFSIFSRKAVEHSIGVHTDWSIWLDYMCIDQSNDEEKGLQVALMDRFYNEAKLTVVLLEDVEISSKEFDFLMGGLSLLRAGDRSKEYVKIVRRILSARWFTRAWCSQEWVLSRSPTIYMHRSDDPDGTPISISWAAFKGWMNRAAIFDPSIAELQLTDPRGNNPRGAKNIHQPIAWAFGIVYDLGCFNQYDKIALVNNLIHVEISARLVDLPGVPPEGSDPRIVATNVVKIVNTLAILRGDYSLLLTSHVVDNPLRDIKGFSWGGPSIRGDPVAQSWTPKLYKVQNNGIHQLTPKGLRVEGLVSQVISQQVWEFRRNVDGLHVMIDGKKQAIIVSDWLSENYPTDRPLQVDQAFFRDLCYIVEAFSLTEAYQLLFDRASDQWPYDPGFGDLKTQLQMHFTHYSLNLMFYVSRLSFLWAGNVGRFSLLVLDDGSKVLARGNVMELVGKTLFQPHVVRPRMINFHVPTVNALVLEGWERGEAECRCVGGLRGFWSSDGGREADVLLL